MQTLPLWFCEIERSRCKAENNEFKKQQKMSLSFKEEILEGITNQLPKAKDYDTSVNHAPKRKSILNESEKKLAIKNALRYIPANQRVTRPC